MPKVASKTQRIQVGNGQFVSVLYIIPVITDVDGHRFEIFTLVSEIYVNVDLVLGIKNVFDLEFLNRSLAIFPKECVVLKAKEQKFDYSDSSIYR